MGKASSKVFNLKGKRVTTIKLPTIFKTPLRPDVIKRAVITLQSHRYQPQGRDPMAGKRTTAESRGVGLGIARVARTKESQRAAFITTAVGGRTTHPPKTEKKIRKKLPRKEMQLAVRSAVAATASKETVADRGHIVEDIPDFPMVVVDDIQRLKKTQEVRDAFIQLGVWSDIYRVKESRKIRAGRGKMRGRRIKQAVGPLLVIDKDEGIAKAADNIPGVNVVTLKDLNVELLAPGTHPGRLTVWTNSAIEKLDERFGVS